jgi:hypothetical protein
MARRGGIASMLEFALIDLIETGESMNYSESRETIEALIASKREAREKREVQARVRKLQFSQHPCPATGGTSGACMGYVIDHVVPLKRGGTDAPRDMQWQTTAEAKAKDKIE